MTAAVPPAPVAPPRPRRRPGTLRTRMTLVMLAVVGLAVIVTGVITVPVVRSSTVGVAQDRLAAQVDLIAGLDRVPAGLDGSQTESATGGTLFAVIDAPGTGAARGPGRTYATDVVRQALASTGTYSGTVRGAAGPALVEARRTSAGFDVVAALPMRDLDPALGQVTFRVLIALAVALAAAAIAAVLLARWLSRPLAATARAARRLAAGERGVDVPVAGPAETSEVALALRALDHALATSEGRQREFLLSISHELRTPLSAIRGYGEALADGVIDPAATADAGRVLVTETDRLDRFVADLLELARLEADDFSIERVDVAAADLVAQVDEAWAARAATVPAVLRTRVGADAGVLSADPNRMRQVLDGLVENALRAVPAGGEVVVVAAADPAGVRFEVSDTGPGLDAGDLDVAFDRGVLRSRYRDTRAVGTGLGLSIAARLVTRLGGTVSARARDGGGAVFTVLLPRG
ncbi:MAG: sensor histidine kinase [Microbacterium sp.]|uniref:histidine kinase n=5 Tax=Bacteria TaxID=2 RepID=A0A0F0LZZ9_9MICO|nr:MULTISPECIES: HAMP domain-containing sensor histidine kinase [Microbacterium]KJL44892.1 Alkaline phosphatase synthesis sensor protein PhoR [Microbacterium ginsengisoli]MAL06658.1 sensor histidine kinase [Microbacterium sp.]MBN9208060.1 HAMP domain-containing histidine kinase [Microbacterium ginsengisoli]MCK9913400.1 HAMP domain-containing histidine kinase [Microbacteriaceae bacterium K1510]